jgi:hypothetical protein
VEIPSIERWVLRDEILASVTLHPNQNAYQAGKSMETALLQLMVWVEKVLDQQEIALDVFLDKEGTLNNTSNDLHVCCSF